MDNIQIKSTSTADQFITENKIREFTTIVDEPIDKGGQNIAPTPLELLGASLASCTIITLQMYFNHKGWDYENVEVDVDIDRSIKPIVFKRSIRVKGTFDEKQAQRIISIANACPVHKILEHGNEIFTNVHMI